MKNRAIRKIRNIKKDRNRIQSISFTQKNKDIFFETVKMDKKKSVKNFLNEDRIEKLINKKKKNYILETIKNHSKSQDEIKIEEEEKNTYLENNLLNNHEFMKKKNFLLYQKRHYTFEYDNVKKKINKFNGIIDCNQIFNILQKEKYINNNDIIENIFNKINGLIKFLPDEKIKSFKLLIQKYIFSKIKLNRVEHELIKFQSTI
jgi:hypothetical protein